MLDRVPSISGAFDGCIWSRAHLTSLVVKALFKTEDKSGQTRP